MNKYRDQKPDDFQALIRTVRIYGHEFIINMDGDVETAEFGCLGHITDCEDFAEMVYELIEVF